MKKSYKKADWYKQRCDEIFKLMKYENHKDHVGYDFVKDGIDIETVAKLHDNCKMNLMDEMENIGTMIAKQQERTFVITEVDYETDEYDQDELDLFQQMAVTAKELGIEEDDDTEDIQDALVNWISETTGWLVNAYSYHEVRPDGTKIDMDGNII